MILVIQLYLTVFPAINDQQDLVDGCEVFTFQIMNWMGHSIHYLKCKKWGCNLIVEEFTKSHPTKPEILFRIQCSTCPGGASVGFLQSILIRTQVVRCQNMVHRHSIMFSCHSENRRKSLHYTIPNDWISA